MKRDSLQVNTENESQNIVSGFLVENVDSGEQDALLAELSKAKSPNVENSNLKVCEHL